MRSVSDFEIFTPVDRFLFFVELLDVDLFAARVENRGWETMYRLGFVLDCIGSLFRLVVMKYTVF